MQIIQNHIPFSLIADIADGRASADNTTRTHLRECRRCASALAQLSGLITSLRTESLEEPPAEAVGAIKALFRSRRPRGAAPAPLPLLGLLRFDSARATPAFGLRTAATTERQLLFSAESYVVDVRITPTDERWAVVGQILGPELTGRGFVELLGQGFAAHIELGVDGEFAFQPAPAGRYTLTISIDDGLIRLSDVELGD